MEQRCQKINVCYFSVMWFVSGTICNKTGFLKPYGACGALAAHRKRSPSPALPQGALGSYHFLLGSPNANPRYPLPHEHIGRQNFVVILTSIVFFGPRNGVYYFLCVPPPPGPRSEPVLVVFVFLFQFFCGFMAKCSTHTTWGCRQGALLLVLVSLDYVVPCVKHSAE